MGLGLGSGLGFANPNPNPNLGEQRAAGPSEGDEYGVRARGGVGGEGEVLGDVPARQLEQVRHLIRLRVRVRAGVRVIVRGRGRGRVRGRGRGRGRIRGRGRGRGRVQVRHVVRGVPDRVVGEEVDVSAAHEVELHGEALRAEVCLDQDEGHA